MARYREQLQVTRKPIRRKVTAPRRQTRIEKMIKVLVKLACANAIDGYGRLIVNQKPVLGLKLERLLDVSMKKTRFHLGIETFVDLLHAAGVKPGMIDNLEMRKLLLRKHRQDVGNLSTRLGKFKMTEKPGNIAVEPITHVISNEIQKESPVQPVVIQQVLPSNQQVNRPVGRPRGRPKAIERRISEPHDLRPSGYYLRSKRT